MGGSGGRFVPRPRPTLTDEQINGCLRDKLRDYNDRDTEAINRHIRGLRDALEQTGADVLPTPVRWLRQPSHLRGRPERCGRPH